MVAVATAVAPGQCILEKVENIGTTTLSINDILLTMQPTIGLTIKLTIETIEQVI